MATTKLVVDPEELRALEVVIEYLEDNPRKLDESVDVKNCLERLKEKLENL